jgi:hypothetical protein
MRCSTYPFHCYTNPSLETTNGAITLTGIGGDSGNGWGWGAYLWESNIQTTGGAITITGTGGNGMDVGYGIYTVGGWDGVHFTTITTDSGTITLNGTGGTGGWGMEGIQIDGRVPLSCG